MKIHHKALLAIVTLNLFLPLQVEAIGAVGPEIAMGVRAVGRVVTSTRSITTLSRSFSDTALKDRAVTRLSSILGVVKEKKPFSSSDTPTKRSMKLEASSENLQLPGIYEDFEKRENEEGLWGQLSRCNAPTGC